MVQLHHKRSDVEVGKYFNEYLEDFSIRYHESISASYIEITLVEFAETALVHLRVVTAVHLSDVESFDRWEVMKSNIAREWDGKVVAE
jgi:hypothetical protein